MTPRLEPAGFLRSLASVIVGLALAAVLMQASGYDARAAYSALASGATGLQSGLAANPNDLSLGVIAAHINKFLLAQSLAKVTPLLFTGLAVGLALRAGLFNIGAQGQMTMGALAAAAVGSWGGARGSGSPTLPSLLHIPLTLLAGASAGALWGALPGLLKARRGVHEVITTIMLNYVALNLATYLVTHGLRDAKSMAVQTPLMAASSWLTPLVPGGNLTVGLFLALLTAFAVAFLMRRTALGYEIRAVGLSAEAARASGIAVARTLVTTMALSGALAGLAGAVETMAIHHRYVQGVAGNYGFDGIAVALLGGLTGPGVILSALFFGALASGAAFMQLQTEVPDSISVIVQALVIIFVGVRFRRADRSVPLEPASELEAARRDNAPV